MKFPKIRKRKTRIIEEGDCKIKHAFDKKEIMSATIRLDTEKKLECLRCHKRFTINEMMAQVAALEGIDMTDTLGLFNKFNRLSKQKEDEEE